MISYARQNPEEQPTVAPPSADDHIAPAPRVSVQAFCETVETALAVRAAGEDRRLGKAHLTVKMGGVEAAIESYRTVPTPNVIILETAGGGEKPMLGRYQVDGVAVRLANHDWLFLSAETMPPHAALPA